MIQKNLLELNKKLLKHKKGSDAFRAIKSQMEKLTLSVLEQIDPSVKTMIDDNHQLLTNSNIKFKVYKEGGSYFGTHATKLKGTMHKNGYVYIEAYKMMLPFIPFAQSMYPTKFNGQINWDGSIDLTVTERNFQFYGSRVPEEFIGNIDENGKVEIHMVKSSFEWTGEHYIHKLLFDPFNGNEQKRSKFIDTTVSLKKKVQNYLEANILSSKL